MTTPAPTSRSREPIQGDEEAGSELRLGEFQDVDALTHSEAALVINALTTKRRNDRKNVNETEYVGPVGEEVGVVIEGEGCAGGLDSAGLGRNCGWNNS